MRPVRLFLRKKSSFPSNLYPDVSSVTRKQRGDECPGTSGTPGTVARCFYSAPVLRESGGLGGSGGGGVIRAVMLSFLLLWTAVPLFVPDPVFGPEMPRVKVRAIAWLTLYA